MTPAEGCIHCSGWGCQRCRDPLAQAERRGGEQGLTAEELQLSRLEHQVVQLQTDLLTAQTAAAVAQRELADARRVIGDAWLAGGATLAQAIQRKTASLERLIHTPPGAA